MDERNFKRQVARSSQDVVAFYDRYADTWDERMGERRSTAAFHRLRLESFLELAQLRPSDRVVEIGVGTGPYLGTIAPRVESVTCVDGSARMLEVLREKHRGLSNLTLRQLDLEQPQETGFDADLVYSFGLLEHIIDTETFLGNCREMLRPGGRMVFISPNGRCPWYHGVRRLWRAGAHCSTDHYYTPEALDLLLQRHGFVREAVKTWGYFPAGTGDVVYAALRLVGGVVDRTPLRRYAGGMTVRYRLQDRLLKTPSAST